MPDNQPMLTFGASPRLVTTGLLLAVLAAGPFGAQQGTAPPIPPEGRPGSIIVVCDDNYPPYIFRNESGGVQGIIPDQWRAWEGTTGVRVDFRAMAWSDALATMASGGADVIDSIFRTEDRLALYDFTKPWADIEVPVFIHRSISGIADATDLRGFRVAVKAGDASIGELGARGVRELVEFPSYEAIIDAAVRGEVRAFCVDKPPALYYLYKRGIDRDFRVAFVLNTGRFHRAVLKGRTGLLRFVQDGFDRIPAGRLEAIDRTWFGTSIEKGVDPAVYRVAIIVAGALLLVAAVLGATAATLRTRVARATGELREKLALLETSEARNKAFIEALPDLYFVLDTDGEYHEVGASSPELVALPAPELVGKNVSDLEYGPGSAERLLGAVRRSIAERRLEVVEYDIRVPAGNRRFEGRIVPLGPDRALLVPRDITDRARHESLLRASLAEKEVLIREVHHRVKNNLQIISSLIALQEDSFRDARDRELLEETQSRIRALARLHEILYNAPDLSSIDAAEYLGSIARGLAEGSDMPIDLKVESLVIGLDQAVPMGLIVTELVTNALKYACRRGTARGVAVRLRREDGDCMVEVSDEGPGLPAGFDPGSSGGLGYTLVRSLVAQLRGTLILSRGPRLTVGIRYPLPPGPAA